MGQVILPEDIQPEWLAVIRRLQSVAKSGGLSVLTIHILVDADGKPISWVAPKQTLIEPKREATALIELALGGKNG